MEHLLKKFNVNIIGNLESQKTIVFAHGFGSNQKVWRYITPSFRNNYRIVLFDLAGSKSIHNDEFNKLRYNTLWDYVDDFLNIFFKLGLENTIVVAHSVSCMISALTAIKYPNLINKIVFVCGSACYSNKKDYLGGLSPEKSVEILGDMANSYTKWIEKYVPIIMSNPDKPYFAEEFAESLKDLRPDIALLVFNMIIKSDYRQEIKQLNAPVLILQPEDDPFVPIQAGEYLHQTIPNNKYSFIKTSGHFPHLTNYGKITEEIAQFL